VASLSNRRPVVSTGELLREFVPPPRFQQVRFENYEPNALQPTQAAAVAALQAFSARGARSEQKRSRFRRSAVPEGRSGVYLDGGYGVGKTHLLASLWHSWTGAKCFGTFVEYTNLVGALGFRTAVEALRQFTLVCIDEFELDDPGDTVLMSTLLGELVLAGVRLAATSNTLPDRLGEGRFAADDFVREIQGLAAHFDILRIEGDDYRHRGLPQAPAPAASETLARLALEPESTLDDFDTLMAHLIQVHPSRYGALLAGVRAVGLQGVSQLTDQAAALRLVVLVFRLYDRSIPVVASGLPLDQVFAPEMLSGGYRKKYFRAVSRLVSLAREGTNLSG